MIFKKYYVTPDDVKEKALHLNHSHDPCRSVTWRMGIFFNASNANCYLEQS